MINKCSKTSYLNVRKYIIKMNNFINALDSDFMSVNDILLLSNNSISEKEDEENFCEKYYNVFQPEEKTKDNTDSIIQKKNDISLLNDVQDEQVNKETITEEEIESLLRPKKCYENSALYRSLRGYNHKLIYYTINCLLQNIDINNRGSKLTLKRKKNENISKTVYSSYIQLSIKDFICKLNPLNYQLIKKIIERKGKDSINPIINFFYMKFDYFYSNIFLNTRDNYQKEFSLSPLITQSLVLSDYLEQIKVKNPTRAHFLEKASLNFINYYSVVDSNDNKHINNKFRIIKYREYFK